MPKKTHHQGLLTGAKVTETPASAGTETEAVFEVDASTPSRRCSSKPKRRVRVSTHARTSDQKVSSFVYLLLHLQGARFKIGISRDPEYRLLLLPDAATIDQEHSLKAELPSEQRAYQVETMLHKALSGYRVSITREPDANQNGDTEWFHLDGFAKACELLSLVPLDGNAAVPNISYLDGRPWSVQSVRWKPPITTAQKRWQDAGDFNVQRMRQIHAHLVALELKCRIAWIPAVSSGVKVLGRSLPASPAVLVIRGLKDCWDPWALNARFAVVSSDLWLLQTGRKAVGMSTHSLASQIRYSPLRPSDLEIELAGLPSMSKLPAGQQLEQIWQQVRWGLLE